MQKYLNKIFSGNKKFITLFVITAVLLLLSGILSPVYLQRTSEEWADDLALQVKEIESSVNSILTEKQNLLLTASVELKEKLRKELEQEASQEAFINIVNDPNLEEFYVTLSDSDFKIISWSRDIAVPAEEFKSLNSQPGEIFFYRSKLITYLTLIDTISSGKEVFYLSTSLPVEKHYTADTEQFRQISLKKELEDKFFTEFDIDYSAGTARTRDGRRYSVEVQNNRGNKIGIITFNKPSLDTTLNSIKEDTETIQSLLAITAFLLLSFYFLSDLKEIKFRILRVLIFFIFLTALRYLMFLLDFPARVLEGELTSSSYFASSFGFGIVRSPAELSVTVLLLLVFSVFLYKETFDHLVQINRKKINSWSVYTSLLIFGVLLILGCYRGLGASIRSVIFDSSLRYFRDPDLLPSLPAGLMQFNILLLGTSVIIAAVSVIILLANYFPKNNNRKDVHIVFIIIFLIVQAAGFIYDAVQVQPQGTPVIRVIFITLILLLSYKIVIEEYRNIYNYLYFVVIGSVISVSLLNYYNTNIERESLKTTALEITRPNEGLLTFLLSETLLNSLENQELFPALKDQKISHESASFIIWNRSLLQRERVKSSIALLDKNKNLLGSFGIDIPEKLRVNPLALTDNVNDLKIYDNYEPEGLNGRLISGVIPVKEGDETIGFIAGSILFNPKEYTINYPPFISGTTNSINTTVDFGNLKIFDFVDSTISNIYGEINPSGATVSQIFNTSFNENNEAWINLKINNEDYTTYLLKIFEQDSDRIIAVMLKEKNLSWDFYNFLKIFFIHSIFIFALFFILFAGDLYRTKKFKFSFRTQLLVAFLLISLVPLIFLAIYNRHLTESKNQDSTLYKLRKRTVSVSDYVNSYINNVFTNEGQLYNKASEDLDINFTLYSGVNKVYSSKDEYYNAGLIPEILNPIIYERLMLQNFKEYIIREEIDGYPFSSFYTTFEAGNKRYIIKVNDVFNRIEYPLSGTEVDVLLFGSYAFAMILIIILSAIFANRISYPIRRLTKATESVAGGDLSFEIEAKQKSEIGDLIYGFNYMIRQLKKSQSELAEMEREIAWKEMARQVAHEIKNPLTPMKLAVQQLIIAYKDKSPKLDLIFEKVSKTLISQIDTLNNIASEFSSFARMPKLKVEEVNPNFIIEDVLNLFMDEKIEIHFNRDNDGFMIEADKDQLKRTIINLIRNSVQASATKVVISSELCDEKVCIEVADNGRGIPPEYMEKVFEPDFTTKEKGMGLGLKLAKKFVEAVNGSIRITKSSLQNGTNILLQFPVLKK